MPDYSLCENTVTVYRMENAQLQRLVIPGCHYSWENVLVTDGLGQRMERKFLLIVPAGVQQVFPGDRIYDGIGPEEVEWDRFIPVNVPGLSVAEYVRICRWEDEICHIEAGRK